MPECCVECNMAFISGWIRTGLQRIVGHGQHPNLQYCPGCKVAYSLDGSLLRYNGSEKIYFDDNYVHVPEKEGVVVWGRLVKDKKNLSKER